VTTTNQAYIIDFGLSTFTYGKFYDLREDNTLENHYFHYEDYRHIGALDMFHIFYTIQQNAFSAPENEPGSLNRTQLIEYSQSMLHQLVYNRCYDTDPLKTEVRHINVNDMIRILGYDEEPIRDINWFYYLMDGLDKKAFTHGGYTLRGLVHTKNVTLLKEMTYRWFLTNFCTDKDYEINWSMIEHTVQQVQHIIAKIEPIEPIALLQTTVTKHRNMSHRKRKNPIKRKLQLSHHRRKPRKHDSVKKPVPKII